jgi:arginine-tRNA-protein transferase
MTREQKAPEIYLSMPHPCSYLPGRMATTLFVDPRYTLDKERFGRFMQLGFRRSGDLVYRPHCLDCTACIPVRIPVSEFRMRRRHRRVWNRNGDLAVVTQPPHFDRAHFELYLRYQSVRHPGGGMDDPDPRKYTQFLIGHGIETQFLEFRQARRLLAVAVMDVLPDGLSAVYTFYEPDEAARGLGVHAILWEIERARALGLPYLYLGYWIKECPKMSYKADYRPLEIYRQGRWQRLED